MAEKAEKVEKLAKHVVYCTPLYESVPVASFTSFIVALSSSFKLFEKFGFSSVRGTYLQIARRKIAEDVLERNKKEPVDFLLWVDSDSVFTVEDIAKLFLTQKKTKADLVSGFYVTKRPPIVPVCYKETKDGFVTPSEVPFNAVFEVDAAGFGFLLMKFSALKKVTEKYGLNKAFQVVDPETGEDLGEDLVFCKLAKKEGLKIVVNSGIQIGHAGSTITPEQFFATQKKKTN